MPRILRQQKEHVRYMRQQLRVDPNFLDRVWYGDAASWLAGKDFAQSHGRAPIGQLASAAEASDRGKTVTLLLAINRVHGTTAPFVFDGTRGQAISRRARPSGTPARCCAQGVQSQAVGVPRRSRDDADRVAVVPRRTPAAAPARCHPGARWRLVLGRRTGRVRTATQAPWHARARASATQAHATLLPSGCGRPNSLARRLMRPIFRAAGADVLYLPARSPWLNPIEKVFGWMKRRVRTRGDNPARPKTAILHAVRALPVRVCLGFINYMRRRVF
jgi:transposase